MGGDDWSGRDRARQAGTTTKAVRFFESVGLAAVASFYAKRISTLQVGRHGAVSAPRLRVWETGQPAQRML